MKSSNIKRLKNCSYFKGCIYKVYSPNKPKSFDDEVSAMDFASKLNAPCRVIIAVQLTFDSISQKEAFLIANQDLRSDIVKSSNSSLEIDCSNALFLYGKIVNTMSGFKTKSMFINK